MKQEKGKISRGKALYRAAKISQLTIKEIAEKAGYKYPTFYVHVKQDDLPLQVLARYGKAMGYSFADEFPEISEYLMEDKNAYGKELSYEQLLSESNKWREKYFEAVDKYNRLVDKYNKVLEERLGLDRE